MKVLFAMGTNLSFYGKISFVVVGNCCDVVPYSILFDGRKAFIIAWLLQKLLFKSLFCFVYLKPYVAF
jgi:hypothetical protein